MNHQIRIFLYGFVVILTIMILLALIAFHTNNDADSSANLAVARQLEKINLTQKLSATITERTQIIQSMLLRDSGNSQSDGWQFLQRLATDYRETLEKLLPELTAAESEHIKQVDSLNRDIDDLNKQVSVLYLNGSRNEATRIFLEEELPKTESQLDLLSELINVQRQNAQIVLERANESSDANQVRFILYAAFAILTSLIVAGLATFYGQRASYQLEEMNDYLEERVSERTESLLDTQKALLEDNDVLAKLASTDTLTGLFNRNHIGDILKKEQSRYQRHSHQFGIILIDVDHFKLVNDNYGHDVGDQVLIQIAQRLKSAIRNSDFIGRWGGEEFLICCTNIASDDIEPIAENIRRVILETDTEVAEPLTISLGCAIIQPGENIDSLIKRADVALYKAKNNGRNRTMLSAIEA